VSDILGTGDEQESLYAQTLRRGLRYSQAASDFFDGSIDRPTLETRLDIGRPELG
jgi:hypothetical protein